MPKRFTFKFALFPCTMIVCAIILGLTFALPFIEDNIPQAYIAQQFLDGRMPYVGTWDQNYPGVLIVHLLALAIGRSAIAFHVIDLALQLVMVWMLYRIASQIYDEYSGAFVAILYSLYYTLNSADDLLGQKDVFAAIALVAAILILLRSNYRKSGVAGLFAGVAVLIRPTYGLHLIVLGLAVMMGTEEFRFRRIVSFVALSSVPFLLFCVAYLFAGTFSKFWDATFVFTTSVYNPQPRLSILFSPVLYVGFLPIFACTGFVVLMRSREHWQAGWLLISLLVASLSSALLLWGYRYHWQPFFVFEQLLAAVGIGALLRFVFQKVPFFGNSGMRTATLACVLLLIITTNFRGRTMSRLLSDMLRGKVTSYDGLYNHFASSAFDPAGEMQLANFLVHHAHTGDRMESFYTTVYPQYAADLAPANRFILTIPLVMRNSSGGFTSMQQRWQQEYRDSMLSVQPKWFLISDPKDTNGIGEGGRLPRQMLHETFPEIEQMIAVEYQPDTTIGIWTLYERH